ncbi:hypothetical protein J6TS2_32790 [Heyndrickxia sporothermodurans]|nr:hypothetical protein J6TS2_32790 [Heyndrickxia sporothermodurans]
MYGIISRNSKKEEVYQTKYVTFDRASLASFQYIERWYNRKRIHGSLGYKTPQLIEEESRKSA